jgi:hypothetical protein
MGRGNPNPKQKLTPQNAEPLSSEAVAVKLPLPLDTYVRSLPDKAAWLRKAIAAQYERDMQAQQEDCA